MATSGSTDFSVSRDDIIDAALRLVGAKRRGITLETSETDNASEALNLIVKSWMAQGLHLWKIKEWTVFLQSASESYEIPGNVTASHVQTTLASSASSGASTISVSSATGISDGDNIGIELDSGSLQWTTVNGAPSGTTVTLTASLTGDAASGNWVYAYTTQADRPLRVVDARLEGSDGEEIPVQIVSRKEYFDLPNKDSEGEVNQIYYDPQLSTGVLYVWPTTNSVRSRLNITVYAPLEDFDAAANTPDFPQEWYRALKWALAAEIGVEKGLPIPRQDYIQRMADRHLSQALAWDDEEVSVYFQPDRGMM